MDHRTTAQEQQGLEEGMRHHMENSGSIGAGPNGQKHEPQLTYRRIGQYLFNIILTNRDGSSQQGRCDPDHGDHIQGERCSRIQ